MHWRGKSIYSAFMTDSFLCFSTSRIILVQITLLGCSVDRCGIRPRYTRDSRIFEALVVILILLLLLMPGIFILYLLSRGPVNRSKKLLQGGRTVFFFFIPHIHCEPSGSRFGTMALIPYVNPPTGSSLTFIYSQKIHFSSNFCSVLFMFCSCFYCVSIILY